MHTHEQKSPSREEDLGLIKKAKKDPEEFTALYDKYVASIYRYFLARVSHKQKAEDLTSTTFLKAFKAFDNYEPVSNLFGTWLFTIARNVLIDNYKKLKTLPLENIDQIISNFDLESKTDTVLAKEKLKRLLEELSEKDKEVIDLRVNQDLSFRQIGKILGISEGGARTAHHRAVKRLEELISLN